MKQSNNKYKGNDMKIVRVIIMIFFAIGGFAAMTMLEGARRAPAGNESVKKSSQIQTDPSARRESTKRGQKGRRSAAIQKSRTGQSAAMNIDDDQDDAENLAIKNIVQSHKRTSYYDEIQEIRRKMFALIPELEEIERKYGHVSNHLRDVLIQKLKSFGATNPANYKEFLEIFIEYARYVHAQSLEGPGFRQRTNLYKLINDAQEMLDSVKKLISEGEIEAGTVIELAVVDLEDPLNQSLEQLPGKPFISCPGGLCVDDSDSTLATVGGTDISESGILESDTGAYKISDQPLSEESDVKDRFAKAKEVIGWARVRDKEAERKALIKRHRKEAVWKQRRREIEPLPEPGKSFSQRFVIGGKGLVMKIVSYSPVDLQRYVERAMEFITQKTQNIFEKEGTFDSFIRGLIVALGNNPVNAAALKELDEKGYLQALQTCAPERLGQFATGALTGLVSAQVTVPIAPLVAVWMVTVLGKTAFQPDHRNHFIGVCKEFLMTSSYMKAIAVGRLLFDVGFTLAGAAAGQVAYGHFVGGGTQPAPTGPQQGQPHCDPQGECLDYSEHFRHPQSFPGDAPVVVPAPEPWAVNAYKNFRSVVRMPIDRTKEKWDVIKQKMGW